MRREVPMDAATTRTAQIVSGRELGAITGDEISIDDSRIGNVRAKTVELARSEVGMVAADHAEVVDSRAGIIVARHLHADDVEARLVVAFSLRGDVTTRVDARSVVLGASVFAATVFALSRLLRR
jgi:hypothetical protein